MRKVTLDKWKKLYNLALEIGAFEPWKKYWDQDLFVIQTDPDKEENFVSILGKGGECKGISLYQGFSGYSDLCQLSSANSNLTDSFVLSDQNCLVAYWDKQEIVPDYCWEIIEKLDFPFSKDGYIFFQSFQKRSFPCLPEADEVDALIDTYEGLLYALKNVDYDLINFENGEIIFISKTEDGEWTDFPLPRPMEPPRYPTLRMDDDELMDELKNQEVNAMEMAIDMDYLLFPIFDEGYERPINPLAYVFYDLSCDQIVGFDLVHPDYDESDVIMSQLIDIIQEEGRPKNIYAKNPYILNWISDFCQELDIQLIDDPIEELNDVYEMLDTIKNMEGLG